MKKLYIEPKTELIDVKLCSMIAVSDRGIDNEEADMDGNGDYNDARRSNNAWDEEDEEDF